MQCSKCRSERIIFQPYSGQSLCRDHFIADFEAKAKRTLRAQRGIQPQDHIAVVLTEDPAGKALLFFLQKLTGSRRDIRISGIQTSGENTDFNARVHNTGATKIAYAASLEEVAAAVLTGILKGEVEQWISDSAGNHGRIARVTPFCHIPGEEIALYARIHGLEGGNVSPLTAHDPTYAEVKAMLKEYTCRHPAAPHALVNLCESLKRSHTITDAGCSRGA